MEHVWTTSFTQIRKGGPWNKNVQKMKEIQQRARAVVYLGDTVRIRVSLGRKRGKRVFEFASNLDFERHSVFRKIPGVPISSVFGAFGLLGRV